MQQKEELNIGILYLAFHNSLRKVHSTRVVTKEELFEKLGRHSLVPKCLREVAIRELIEMGLLKREDKNMYRILEYELNIEEDANKFLERIHLF
jgi:hypothetical protein